LVVFNYGGLISSVSGGGSGGGGAIPRLDTREGELNVISMSDISFSSAHSSFASPSGLDSQYYDIKWTDKSVTATVRLIFTTPGAFVDKVVLDTPGVNKIVRLISMSDNPTAFTPTDVNGDYLGTTTDAMISPSLSGDVRLDGLTRVLRVSPQMSSVNYQIHTFIPEASQLALNNLKAVSFTFTLPLN
jgi:hypothetical protein